MFRGIHFIRLKRYSCFSSQMQQNVKSACVNIAEMIISSMGIHLIKSLYKSSSVLIVISAKVNSKIAFIIEMIKCSKILYGYDFIGIQRNFIYIR